MKYCKSLSPFNRSAVAAIISLLSMASTGFIPVLASPSRLTTPSEKFNQLRLIASTFPEAYPLLPRVKRMKYRPTTVEMFQLDNEPLGDRSPFLMVHGLRGEYRASFRWQKLTNYLKKNDAFNARYKIYLVRYSSLDRISFNLQNYKNAFNHLYQVASQKPITVLALSMGGNLAYEAMTDKDIDSKTKTLMTLGTPFHGSPLFDKEWLNYSLYKELAWPWTRTERYLTYRFYFNDNPQLRQDLGWDNVDGAVPEAGAFQSKLLGGPRGHLTIGDTVNDRLNKVNAVPIDRRKLIAYSGYMINPYLSTGERRKVQSAFLYPYFALFTSFPAHFGREHAALGLINHDMCCVPATKEVEKKAGDPYIYVLNDGIAPVTSALFIPPDVAKEQYLAHESDIVKLRDKLDIGQARVFRGVDHLTFIGSAPKTNAVVLHTLLKDGLNPEENPKDMFDWILSDVLHTDDVSGRLAKKGSESSRLSAPAEAATERALEPAR